MGILEKYEQTMREQQERYLRACGRLRQYARYLTGRITGSLSQESGMFKQLSELDECRYYQRVELNALTKLLLEKGVFTSEELLRTMADEAVDYEKVLHHQFPEVRPSEDGKSVEIQVAGLAARLQKEGWPA